MTHTHTRTHTQTHTPNGSHKCCGRPLRTDRRLFVKKDVAHRFQLCFHAVNDFGASMWVEPATSLFTTRTAKPCRASPSDARVSMRFQRGRPRSELATRVGRDCRSVGGRIDPFLDVHRRRLIDRLAVRESSSDDGGNYARKRDWPYV